MKKVTLFMKILALILAKETNQTIKNMISGFIENRMYISPD